jgi:hypothetical protein
MRSSILVFAGAVFAILAPSSCAAPEPPATDDPDQAVVEEPMAQEPMAQEPSAEEAQVIAVVQQLFDGMRNGDSELMRSLFHPDARMTGTGIREGSYRASMNPPDGWIESVASYSGPPIDERFYDPTVEISGPLASVWTEYDLYVGEEFRHCGVDAFHLALTDDGWKIVHVADTRVQEGCPTR